MAHMKMKGNDGGGIWVILSGVASNVGDKKNFKMDENI